MKKPVKKTGFSLETDTIRSDNHHHPWRLILQRLRSLNAIHGNLLKNCSALLAIFKPAHSGSNRVTENTKFVYQIKKPVTKTGFSLETDTIRTCDLHLRRVAL